MTIASSVAVYGGANIDIKWRALEQIFSGSSSAGEMSTHFGGVARNIAESLARLQVPVSLISCVGNDDHGKRVIQHLEELGVLTKDIFLSPSFPTATYCAFFRPSGELYTALTDLRIYQHCQGDVLKEAIDNNCEAKIHLFDTDLPDAAIEQIVNCSFGQLWVAVTCIPAVRKPHLVLSKLDALFLNQSELFMLAKPSSSLKGACYQLLEMGLKFVVVTLGREGAYLASKDEAFKLPAAEIEVVDVTGAGDALVAGFISRYLLGLSLRDCLRFGMKAAFLTLQTYHSVSPDLRTLISPEHDHEQFHQL